MKLHFVDSMDEVLALALEGPLPTPLPEEAQVMASVQPPVVASKRKVARQ